MRLDVFLAQREGLSRTKCRELIREGRVKVGGKVLTKPACAVYSGKEVEIAEGKSFVSRGGLNWRGPLKSFPPWASK